MSSALIRRLGMGIGIGRSRLRSRDFKNMSIFATIDKAELRASVFASIEEEDKTIEKEEGLPPALLGSCNDRAKQLHASPSACSSGLPIHVRTHKVGNSG